MYESVNVLGGAIQVDFDPQCIMKECRAGLLNFLPTFLHLHSALFDIKSKDT